MKTDEWEGGEISRVLGRTPLAARRLSLLYLPATNLVASEGDWTKEREPPGKSSVFFFPFLFYAADLDGPRELAIGKAGPKGHLIYM
jgi:hypothetical protein